MMCKGSQLEGLDVIDEEDGDIRGVGGSGTAEGADTTSEPDPHPHGH